MTKRTRHALWLDMLSRQWLRIPPGVETIYLRDDEDPKPDIDIDWYAERMRQRIDLDAFRHAREILLLSFVSFVPSW